jgi:3',5'-cyclic AMP phosphodiesterase CpdA
MIRLAHFSDIHLISPRLEWKLHDWFSKRLTSWFNYRVLGRAVRFAYADEIVPRLVDDMLARGVDHLVFSGDATVLGFESEVRRAAQVLRVGQIPIPGLAVPGNHDYLTRKSAASGVFEAAFAPWQQGRRIGNHPYPFAQQVGPVWLIGVNAATGNRLPWNATGNVGTAQLARLQQLLEALPAGIKILVIHYPICRSNGRPEMPFHGLRDLDAVLKVARAGGVNLWLHGHRHTPYHLQEPLPAICAGAATQHGIWSYNEYAIEGDELHAVRRTYDPEGRCFREGETFSLRLSHNEPEACATDP